MSASSDVVLQLWWTDAKNQNIFPHEEYDKWLNADVMLGRVIVGIVPPLMCSCKNKQQQKKKKNGKKILPLVVFFSL